MLRRAWMLAAVALVAALALTGCGNGDEDPEDTPPTLSVDPSSDSPTSESTAASSATSDGTDGTATTKATDATSKATSAGPADLTQPPTTYAEAEAHLDALRGGSAQQATVFRTPDDIYCALTSGPGTPACEAPYGGGVKDEEVCADAQSDLVGRIELTGRGARALCNTDTIRESMPKPTAAPALMTNSASGIQCAIETIGVTCIDPATEAGFFLAKGAYRVF